MVTAEATREPPDAAESLREGLDLLRQSRGQRPWVYRLATSYLHYRDAHPEHHHVSGSEAERAEGLVRRACVKSALSGATSGLLTTSSAVIIAELGPGGVLLGLPTAVLGILGEMIYRLMVHLDLCCDIADVYGIRFDPDEPHDFWQLMSLAFGKVEDGGEAAESDPGKAFVEKVLDAEAHEVGEEIGDKLLGESVLRNVVPVLGIATSSITNWRRTRHMGDVMRRYLRYRRALHDALAADESLVADHFDLLIEGMWFVFTSDGKLSKEEAGLLARKVQALPKAEQKRVLSAFTGDESAWVRRLSTIPDARRDAFLHAIQVAAAVDKEVTLPEEKLLAKTFHALGRTFDPKVVEKMVHTLEVVGVLPKAPLPPKSEGAAAASHRRRGSSRKQRQEP